jgi:type I restriction enzyme R subunit
MITKYLVLNETEKSLMIMRPYQFFAVERIIDRVLNSNKN